MKLLKNRPLTILISVLVLWILLSRILINLFGFTDLNADLCSATTVIVIVGLSMEHLLYIPKPNHGAILRNPLVINKVLNLKSANEIRRPGDQRVALGFTWKWPWEEVVGEPISLEKMVPLGTTVEVQVGDIPMVIKWVGGLSAIPGDALVMHPLVQEEAVVKLRTAEIEAWIQRKGQDSDPDEVRKNPKQSFKDALEELYGGDSFTDSENKTGRYVSMFEVSSADKKETSQEVDERLANATKLGAAVANAIDNSKQTDPIIKQVLTAAVLGRDLPGGILQILNPKSNKGKP